MTEAAELDEFSHFQTVGEIIGFLFARCGGEPALRGFLALDEHERILMRENCLSAAKELDLVGLHKAAKIMREAARTRPEQKYQCRYSPNGPGGPANVRSWIMQQKQHFPDFDESRIVYPNE